MDDGTSVRRTIERYFAALDAHDWTSLRSCFTEDADYGAGGRPPDGEGATWLHGREDILALMHGVESFEASTHTLSSASILVNGDEASATTQAMAAIATSRPIATVTLRGLRYEDHLRRTDGTWRIYRRLHIPMWQSELAAAPPQPTLSTTQLDD